MKRFVLLDRDGTVNKEVNYLSQADQIELYAGTGKGLRRMREMGLGLIVLTNQSGLARGYFTPNDLDMIHQRLLQFLADEGVRLDGIFHCPHLPEDVCDCRKPRPGLVEQAVERFDFDPTAAFVIGDKPCDIDLGRTVGATTILVRTGYGGECERSGEVSPDHVADDVEDASLIIQALLAGQREDSS